MDKIKHGKFEEIENDVKPRALKYCKSNALLMGMKVRIFMCVYVSVFFFFFQDEGEQYAQLLQGLNKKGNKLLMNALPFGNIR